MGVGDDPGAGAQEHGRQREALAAHTLDAHGENRRGGDPRQQRNPTLERNRRVMVEVDAPVRKKRPPPPRLERPARGDERGARIAAALDRDAADRAKEPLEPPTLVFLARDEKPKRAAAGGAQQQRVEPRDVVTGAERRTAPRKPEFSVAQAMELSAENTHKAVATLN